METTTKINSCEAINKFFYFSMNYPYNFIEKVWGEIKPFSLSEHLQKKYEHLYDLYGSYGVMNAFYGELSTNNRVKLMEWVMDNYNDEVKIKSFNFNN